MLQSHFEAECLGFASVGQLGALVADVAKDGSGKVGTAAFKGSVTIGQVLLA